MSEHCDVLIFAEDPGAANLFTSLPGVLSHRGIRSTLLATSHALSTLKASHTPHCALGSGDSAEELLERFQPALVLTGTSENVQTMGLRLIEACRNKGIVTAGAVDAAMNAGRRFSGPTFDDPLRFAPDFILVTDDWTGEAFKKLGVPSARIVLCGHPHFDRLLDRRDEFLRQGKASVRRSALPLEAQGTIVVTFISEGSARTAFWDDRARAATWMRGWTGQNGRTELAFETFLPLLREMIPQAHVILRLHPKDVAADFEIYRGHASSFSIGGDPSDLIFASDLVVGMTSMPLTEAALLGIPVLSLIPHESELAWLPALRAGTGSYAMSKEALIDALRLFRDTGSLDANRDASASFVLRGADARISDFIGKAIGLKGHATRD